jgi:hypothetical protein
MTHRFGIKRDTPKSTHVIRRVHMTGSPVETVRSVSQIVEPDQKPKGFWYAIGRSWIEWCECEMPDWRKSVLQEVIIDPSKILFLRTPKDILEFSREYGVADYFTIGVDWVRVAKHYSGIEIAPYQYSLRFSKEAGWYYGWDIASGCIWDASAIVALKLITEADLPEEQEEID